MITIDKLRQEDLQGLKELYENAFGGETDYEKMNRTYHEIMNDESHIILCAKINGLVVGSILGIVCKELIGQSTPFMVLEDVAVLEPHRRLGIAKQLMLKMEEHAKLRKCNMIIFVSSEHRIGAHNLYESLGYGLDKVKGYRKRLD